MASSIPRTFTPLFSPSHVGSGTKIRGTLASLSAALVLLCASSSNAGDTCTASVEKSPCTAASGGGDDYCCAPGWVFDNNWASSAGSPGGISVTWSSSSMQFTQKYNLNDSCCEALYAGIGNIGSTVVTDTYNQPGSHLPLQLKDIALLKGAWTIQVPPVKSSDIYRVYYEMFLSSTTAGLRDKGNITIDFYHPLYDYGGKISHTSLLGYSDMEVVDYGAQTNANQGPFIAFALPSDAYTPDKNGVITISSVDVAAVLDWALTNYPKYYSNTIYLTELNLAEEAMTVSGTFTTTFASFEIQKTGSPVVYDPTFTDSFWTNGTMSSGAPLSTGDGGASSGSASGSSGGAASGSGGGAASSGSSGAASGSSGGVAAASSGAASSSGGVSSGTFGASSGSSGSGAPAASPGAQGNGSSQGGCSAGAKGNGRSSAAMLVVALGLALRRGRKRSAAGRRN